MEKRAADRPALAGQHAGEYLSDMFGEPGQISGVVGVLLRQQAKCLRMDTF